jgi:hypothetical protein
MNTLERTTWRILIRLFAVVLVVVVPWATFCWLIYTHPVVGSDRYLVGRDRVAVGFQVSTFFVTFLVSCAGLLTLMAALTPRWLSRIGIGPNLEIDWRDRDWAYVQRWDRLLFTPANPKGIVAPAVLIRMRVRNRGVMAAEAVQVMIETISVEATSEVSKPPTIAKYSPLRWADSYDIEDLEKLKRHRCDTAVEPLIHAGATQYVDFGFIFAPGSPFYADAGSNSGRSGPTFWCFHPFYQWIGADEYAVLGPGKTYGLTLALSAKNSHLERVDVKVKCDGGAMKAGIQYSQVVGSLGSSCPIQIQIGSSHPNMSQTSQADTVLGDDPIFWTGEQMHEVSGRPSALKHGLLAALDEISRYIRSN